MAHPETDALVVALDGSKSFAARRYEAMLAHARKLEGRLVELRERFTDACGEITRISGELAEYKARAERAEIAQVEHFRKGCAVSETGTPEQRHQNETGRVMFRAGLLACREYMARFVEAQDPAIAQSIRANWWPCLGDDPGAPRKLRWDEVAEPWGEEERQVKPKQIPLNVEALPEALTFLEFTKP